MIARPRGDSFEMRPGQRISLRAADDLKGHVLVVAILRHGDLGAQRDAIRTLGFIQIEFLGVGQDVLDVANAPLDEGLLSLGLLIARILAEITLIDGLAEFVCHLLPPDRAQVFEFLL
jgi:hypothetical protein